MSFLNPFTGKKGRSLVDVVDTCIDEFQKAKKNLKQIKSEIKDVSKPADDLKLSARETGAKARMQSAYDQFSGAYTLWSQKDFDFQAELTDEERIALKIHEAPSPAGMEATSGSTLTSEADVQGKESAQL